jgi:hypothetical protein
MTRRLKVVNALLFLFLAAICQVMWKRAHDASMARSLLSAPLKRAEFSRGDQLPAISPLKASSYLGIAEGYLLSPDRNATITLPAPTANIISPPPLPVLSGVILMTGLPPTVLLSARSLPEKRAYHAGDTIDGWQIDSFNSQQIVLEWQGEQVTKRLTELMDRSTSKVKKPPPSPKERIAPNLPPQQPVGD